MSFFEPPRPRSSKPPEPLQPPWIGPAENVLGAGVGLALVLARTGDVGVGLSGVVAESNGVAFELDFRRRFGAFPGTDWGKPFPPAYPGESRDERDFRFGVQFSDGRKATDLREFPSSEPVDLSDPASHCPRLTPRGGGGGGRYAAGLLALAAATPRASRVRLRVAGRGHPADARRGGRSADHHRRGPGDGSVDAPGSRSGGGCRVERLLRGTEIRVQGGGDCYSST